MTTDAAAFFAAHLSFQTDVADVHTALASGAPGFVLVDVRSRESFAQGHVPEARHVPTAELPGDLDPAVPVVVHCWGPGCNGATKAALTLTRLGYTVREMIGGFEYWVREGLAVAGQAGRVERPADPLTTTCGC